VLISNTDSSTPEDGDDSIITDTQAETSSRADVSEKSTPPKQLEDMCRALSALMLHVNDRHRSYGMWT